MIPAALVLTGNNYSKFSLLCQALNVKIPGEQSFLNSEKHYIAPTVFDFWEQMNVACSNVLGDKELCILGDGCSDSPGHCARCCSYVVMENEAGTVLDIQIVDVTFDFSEQAFITIFIRSTTAVPASFKSLASIPSGPQLLADLMYFLTAFIVLSSLTSILSRVGVILWI